MIDRQCLHMTSLVDIEVSTDNKVPGIEALHFVEDLHVRNARIVIEDQQLWLRSLREISQLGCRRVVLAGKTLKRLRPRSQPTRRLRLMNQNVASAASINGVLRRIGVT